jgi:hypothetical protein
MTLDVSLTLAVLILLVTAAVVFAAMSAAGCLALAIRRMADAIASARHDHRTVIYGDPQHVHLSRIDADLAARRTAPAAPLTIDPDEPNDIPQGAEGDG